MFEVGKVMFIDESREIKMVSESKLVVVLVYLCVIFIEVKEIFEGVMCYFGFEYEFEEVEYLSFILGRVGKIIVNGEMIGVIGEIYLVVLENWGIEMFVVVFELFFVLFYMEFYL